jgi:sec-independent protein translocase protein TatB
MFEVGFTELLVIFVLALVVLGPEKLPRLAQQVGRWIGRARAMAKQFREQLEDEVNLADMKKWEQTATKPTPAPEPPPAQPAHASSSPYTATSDTETATPAATATTPETSSVTPDSAAPESPSAPGTPEHQAASTGHHSGPPPEPEAAVYQPPAYATSNGSTPHASSTDSSHTVESPPSHEPVATADEPPARPGDVITHTHERGI